MARVIARIAADVLLVAGLAIHSRLRTNPTNWTDTKAASTDRESWAQAVGYLIRFACRRGEQARLSENN